MQMPWPTEKKPPSYKSYKADKFNQKKEKARLLAQSIGDLSLKPEDKAKLKQEIIKIIEETKI